MSLLEEVVLPADVVVRPVQELPPAVRDRLEHTLGDHAVTRPRSRTPSSIVDASTARLLELLREPATVVDAVLRFSRAEGLDPRSTLDSAYPVLAGLFDAGLLTAAGSELARPVEATLHPGDVVGSFRVTEPVHVIVDTEVHLARATDGSWAALKVARPGSHARLRGALRYEAEVLGHLDGTVNAPALEHGEADGGPYLAVAWRGGVDALDAAAEARRRGDAGRPDLLAIAASICGAYAHLHGQGVLHGDVHPRNVLVDAHQRVTLVDFGLAAEVDPGTVSRRRGCVDLFMEPEYAGSLLADEPPPPATPAGEQYGVACLVYAVLVGAHTHDFSLEDRAMQRQVVAEPPLAFARHGVDLPHLEPVLQRALRKDPRRRFPDMRSFSEHVRDAAAADLAAAGTGRPRRSRGESQLLPEVLGRLGAGPAARGRLEPPTASVNNGAAGLAYALLRIACARDDERLLAAADLWSRRAVRDVDAGQPEAFFNPALGVDEATVGRRSLFHGAAGVHYVDALVARARGDEMSQRRALDAFVASSGPAWSHPDVAFGRAGLLLGCARLLPTTAPHRPQAQQVRALGDALLRDLWSALEPAAPISAGSSLPDLGAAHGWAGVLYATMLWCQASGAPLPDGPTDRLDELAALATPAGRGLRWATRPGSPHTDLQASWCNGAAGHVHLWTLAETVLGDRRYGELACGAAWTAYEAPPVNADLCCGLAGRSYALLALHGHTHEPVWLDRARSLADRAADGARAAPRRADRLFQGEVGVALLLADLDGPDPAGMPVFGSED